MHFYLRINHCHNELNEHPKSFFMFLGNPSSDPLCLGFQVHTHVRTYDSVPQIFKTIHFSSILFLTVFQIESFLLICLQVY